MSSRGHGKGSHLKFLAKGKFTLALCLPLIVVLWSMHLEQENVFTLS